MPAGYGIYEDKDSSTFRPGEDIILYIEPIGFEYGKSTDEYNDTSYNIDFTIHFKINDREGDNFVNTKKIHVDDINSHFPNKEIFLAPVISQISKFPEGDYVITYTIDDENSENSFELIKEITISED
jgi:hypothetical protein